MMTKKEKKELADWVIQQAKKEGAQEVSIVISEGKSLELLIREQKIDQLKESISLSIGIDLYVDQRFSSHSSCRLNKTDLIPFIKEAVASTRYLNIDTYRKLPDPKLYFKGEAPNLYNCDENFNNIKTEEKLKLAFETEFEVYGTHPKIISIETSYSDSIGESLMVNSNGFEGFRRRSNFDLCATISIQGAGDALPSDYEYDGNIFFSELKKTGIGTAALDRVLKKEGQQKLDSGIYSMLVENRVASQLLSPLISALQGSSIQQKNSFLIEMQGQQVVSPLLHLTDAPHLPSCSGSRYYDYEGLATKERILFNNGKVENYNIDTYYANKLGVAPTSGQTTNLMMRLGEKNAQEMLQSQKKIFFITGFNGGNCNSTTGDFSYGVEGFLYEDGKMISPISEMNITGNMLELWKSLHEVGNDPVPHSTWKIPTLLFHDVNFSGK